MVKPPARPPAPPHQSAPNRPLWQTYRYDWLGNASQSDDDQHVYYDRSLGNITNNVTSDQATSAGPQLNFSMV